MFVVLGRARLEFAEVFFRGELGSDGADEGACCDYGEDHEGERSGIVIDGVVETSGVDAILGNFRNEPLEAEIHEGGGDEP